MSVDGLFTPYQIAEGTYRFNYVINDAVCPRTIQVIVKVDPLVCPIEPCQALIIHNAVTPNGDDLNEVFIIEYLDNEACYPENTVEIYNRWGIMVFDAENYNNREVVFKGKSEGRSTVKQSAELPNGIYFYILKYKTGEGNYVTKNGYIYLTRD
jgi:gliding motility-associated-like protein